MSPKRKFLIVGLGAIGQRHARNLRHLYGDEIELLAFRQRRASPLLDERLQVRPEKDIESSLGIRPFTDLEVALAEKPLAVFIANPTSLHLPVAQRAAEAGCHLFIEKPLTHSLAGIGELRTIVEKAGVIATVGYQFRFHPALHSAREHLKTGRIGRLIGARAEYGEYLPGWHPYEDYRRSYAARADLGGGVLLTQIHDFDYLGWLFGWPTRVFATGGTLSRLEVDVEDTVCAVLDCRQEDRLFPVQLWQDFVRRTPQRWCEVIGEEGTLRIDLRENRLSISAPEENKCTQEEFPEFTRNTMFLDQMRDFVNCMVNQIAPAVTLHEATCSLAAALAAKESMRTGQAVVPSFV